MTTPTPEAIEAARAGIADRMTWASLHWGTISPDAYQHLATAAVISAYPLMVAQAKAEALIAFADAHRMPWTMFNHEGQQVTVGDLLREQAAAYRATIEGKSE